MRLRHTHFSQCLSFLVFFLAALFGEPLRCPNKSLLSMLQQCRGRELLLHSTSWQEEILRDLMLRLEEGALTRKFQVQYIFSAGHALFASPSRERCRNVRQHCSVFMVPLRVKGFRAARPTKELADAHFETLCETAWEVLMKRSSGVSERFSMQASSASEHPVTRVLCDSRCPSPKRSRQQGPATVLDGSVC